ncbi:MAG: hypothetical protein JW747_08495, partial [Candidatus Aminicenantes bacterium]|nr:hypothetical protein [Candidatus Aminicenantes bacterium]
MKDPAIGRERPAGRTDRAANRKKAARPFLRAGAAFLISASFASFSLAGPAAASRTESQSPLLRVEADAIAYSFDQNRFIAQNASFALPPYRVSCRTLKADLSARAFLAIGGVVLSREGETLRADALSFDPVTGGGLLFIYGKTVESRALGGAERPAPAAEMFRAAEAVSQAAVRASLLYAVCRSLDITPSFDAVGRDVVLFVEGLESLGFRSLKLSVAEAAFERRPGLALNSLWFNRDRGLQVRASYSALDPGRLDSLTRIEYEEHSFIKEFAGPPRQADLKTETSWTLRPGLGLGFQGNANTSGLASARLWLDKSRADKKVTTLWDLTVNRPLGRPAEAWLGLKSALNAGRAGRLTLAGRVGTGDQAAGELDYAVRLGEAVDFRASSSYTQVSRGPGGVRSKIFDGRLRLAYASRIFNLASDYHLNADLAEGRSLRSPRLRLESAPLPFYGGLLRAELTNAFLHSILDRDGRSESNYSNNTRLRLSAAPVPLTPALLLDFSLALEQFLEKEGRNFTSGGAVVNLKRRWARGVTLEGFYSLQSRRRTRGGWLEGTTS